MADDRVGLRQTAYLYASGELVPSETEAFEALLAVDQVARDALCEAMHLMLLAVPRRKQGPATAYRSGVRRYFRRRNRFRRLRRSCARLVLPILWLVLGASAAGIGHDYLCGIRENAPVSTAPRFFAKAEPAPGKGLPSPEAAKQPWIEPTIALFWAEQPQGDHLRKTWANEQKRKRFREQNRGRNVEAEEAYPCPIPLPFR